jgi:hypothetical protein
LLEKVEAFMVEEDKGIQEDAEAEEQAAKN